ncbi:hypothetical protein [Streptomyces sp. NPDC003247]|uniref:hypothetical protein n=1 Tax=Streptomyces sp. NPDC003247 TaxID=3364677 RepID=UPI003682EBC6
MDTTKSVKGQYDEGCLHCGEALMQQEGPGRVRLFCNPDHNRVCTYNNDALAAGWAQHHATRGERHTRFRMVQQSYFRLPSAP